jgi:hypothetical protein
MFLVAWFDSWRVGIAHAWIGLAARGRTVEGRVARAIPRSLRETFMAA